MSLAPQWTSTVREGEVRFELMPAGVRGFYRTALAAVIVFGSLVLPLGILGLFGGVFWRDFPPALRLAMAIFGGAAVVASLGLPARLLIDATTLRARVRVLPGGVFVERGRVAPALALWLSPREDVGVEMCSRRELERGGLELSCGAQKIRIAVGFEAELQPMLAAIRDALRNIAAGPVAGPPPSAALGPSWSARLLALGGDLLRPLRRPTAFLLLDLGALAGSSLLQWVFVDVVERRAAYPVAFSLFLVGLAARRFDGSYIAGLRRHLADEPLWGFYYMLAGAAIGLAGLVGVVAAGGRGVWLFMPALVAVALHAATLKRARAESPPPSSSRALDLALAFPLIPLSVLHERAMFEFLSSADDLGPLALCFILPTVLVAYLPVRLHAFVDAPDDRSNVVWFWLTVGLLALQPLLTLGPAIAREL